MSLAPSRGFWLTLVTIMAVTAAAIVLVPVYRVALLGSGYMAQTLCGGMFVSGRAMDELMAQELSGPSHMTCWPIFSPRPTPRPRR